MVYDISFTKHAEREFSKLNRILQQRIINTLERIRIRPEAYVVKLVGDPAFKLRVGDYRLLLDINQSKLIILVIKIGHRKKVYDVKARAHHQ